MFNSQTKLGDTKNRNRRLKSLIEDFAKLDLRPSRIVADGQGHKTAEDVRPAPICSRSVVRRVSILSGTNSSPQSRRASCNWWSSA